MDGPEILDNDADDVKHSPGDDFDIREQELFKTLSALLPGVCQFLAQHDTIHSDRFVKFVKLLEQGRFPLENICWLVFSDLVQRLSAPLNAIKYTPAVKQFWYVGKLLFNNRFLNWMRGLPEHVNFPVPHNISNPNSDIPDQIKPGFIGSMADLIAQNKDNKKFNLSCDLKKINASKVDPMGMVDLGGFESAPTKRDIEQRMENENPLFSDFKELCKIDVNHAMTDEQTRVVERKMNEYILLATARVWDLWDYVAKKERALQSLFDRVAHEKDWTKSKLAFVISLTKTDVTVAQLV